MGGERCKGGGRGGDVERTGRGNDGTNGEKRRKI